MSLSHNELTFLLRCPVRTGLDEHMTMELSSPLTHWPLGDFSFTKVRRQRSIYHIDGLVHERRNSIANALKLSLSCTNPLICGQYHDYWCPGNAESQGDVSHGVNLVIPELSDFNSKRVFSCVNLALVGIPLTLLLKTGNFLQETCLLCVLSAQLSFIISCQNVHTRIFMACTICDFDQTTVSIIVSEILRQWNDSMHAAGLCAWPYEPSIHHD